MWQRLQTVSDCFTCIWVKTSDCDIIQCFIMLPFYCICILFQVETSDCDFITECPVQRSKRPLVGVPLK